MLFNSMIFLWIFLPIVLVGNFMLSKIPFSSISKRYRAKNIFLLISSLLFYSWGGLYYLLIMISTIIIDYVGGYLLGISKKRYRKIILIITIIINISVLFYFKYFNLLMSCLHSINKGFDFKEVVLPIGISFFTFQAMSYVIDVYWEKVSCQKNFITFALYVSLFPQLIAGPIVQYKDVEQQLHSRTENYSVFLEGQKRFCYGLAKKVIIANTMAKVADEIWALDISKIGYQIAWLGIISYTLQIYFDFSGYSDMAIGIGKMLGFQFKENFNYPYISGSIKEFWRRWHISLSSWFKDYIYIPLGGSRKGNIRTLINLFIVFLLTGIWHGANFTFWIWGIYYGIILIIEKLFWGKLLDKNPVKPLNWLYSILVIMIGWIFFRSDDLSQAFVYISQLFAPVNSTYNILSYISIGYLIALFIAIMFSGLLQMLFMESYKKIKDDTVIVFIDYSIQIVLIIICIRMIVSGTYNAFIYFQF